MERRETYEAFIRKRISELIVQRDISEHFLSLELGKSGSYIRAITSGRALPSVRELFNIMDYFNLTPMEFFAGAGEDNSLRAKVIKDVSTLEQEKLEKVAQIMSWF